MINSIMKNNSFLPYIKVLKIIFPLAIILSVWEIAAFVTNDSFFLPGVRETSVSLFKIFASGDFLKVILTAFYRVFSGLLIGIILGITLAFLCRKFEPVNTVIAPIISIMKATPVACIIVLLWIRLNYTEIAIFVVLLMVLPIIWQNVYDAIGEMDKSMIEVADVFRLNRFQRIKILVIPSVLSYLLPAVVTSIGLAWKAEIAAEIMTNSNIGRLIYDFKTVSYDTASIFAWTVIIVTLSIIFEKGAKYLLGRLTNVLKT